MTNTNLEARVAELEMRIAFQDETIAELNDVVVLQRNQLDRLERLLESLRSRMHQLAGTSSDDMATLDTQVDPYESEKPPHY